MAGLPVAVTSTGWAGRKELIITVLQQFDAGSRVADASGETGVVPRLGATGAVRRCQRWGGMLNEFSGRRAAM